MAKKQVKSKGIISGVLSFLIAAFLTGTSVLVGAKTGFCSVSMMVNLMCTDEYSSNVLEKFVTLSKDLSIPTGMPDTVMEGFVSKEDVKKDLRGFATASFRGQDYVFDTSGMQGRLQSNIEKYFKESGITLSESQAAAVPEFTAQIAKEYEQILSSMIFVKAISKVLPRFDKGFVPGLLICVALALLAVAFTVMFQLKRLSRAFAYLAYGTLATALVNILLPGFLLLTGPYRKMTLEPEYFYNYVMSYINKSLSAFIFIGIFWAVISAILIVLSRKWEGRRGGQGQMSRMASGA